MSLQKCFEVDAASLSALTTSSIIQNAIFATPLNAEKSAAMIQCGNLSSTGILALDIFTGPLSSVSAAWQPVLTTSVVASSMSSFGFDSLARPLLPFMRLQVQVKASGGGTTVFENVVAKLFTNR